MTIQKILNGERMTIFLSGRLDTTAASQLEADLERDLDGVEILIFDFENLEYLSSAGLRVLLSAHKSLMKKEGGKLIIRHVNETMHEVFEVTGFLDILNIE